MRLPPAILRPRVALALLAVFGLAGCDTLSQRASELIERIKAARAQDERPVPARPAARRGDSRDGGERSKTRMADTPAPAETPSAGPAEKPAPKLVGLTEQQARALLGPPSKETEEPPGKIWHYRVGGCRLAVHLFPDMDRGGFYALEYTATGSESEICLSRVAAEKG